MIGTGDDHSKRTTYSGTPGLKALATWSLSYDGISDEMFFKKVQMAEALETRRGRYLRSRSSCDFRTPSTESSNDTTWQRRASSLSRLPHRAEEHRYGNVGSTPSSGSGVWGLSMPNFRALVLFMKGMSKPPPRTDLEGTSDATVFG